MRSNFIKPFQTVRCCPIPARALTPEIEAFELVEAIHALVVYPPAFPPEQRVDAPVTVSDPGEGDLPDAGDKRVVITGARRVIEGRPGQHDHPARASGGDTVGVDEILRDHAPLSRSYSFFLTTS